MLAVIKYLPFRIKKDFRGSRKIDVMLVNIEQLLPLVPNEARH
jgi:hypothetical protein